MSLMYQILVTRDEVNLVCYALKELAGKRLEQAIDSGSTGYAASARHEANQLRELWDRIYEATKPGSPQGTAERGEGKP